jgi:hypothetical protein
MKVDYACHASLMFIMIHIKIKIGDNSIEIQTHDMWKNGAWN